MLSVVLLAGGMSAAGAAVQPAPVWERDLRAAIDQLGDFDYDVRTRASSLVRRAPQEQARPALAAAVSGHEIGRASCRERV